MLNFISSMSSPTFLIALWNALSSSLEYSSLSLRISCSAQTLSKKRLQPLMEEVDHGALFSKSPMNISYKRMVSAPYSRTMSSGLTTLPRDLLIFSPFSPRIMPWLVRFAYGSGLLTMPMSYRNLCQKRE